MTVHSLLPQSPSRRQPSKVKHLDLLFVKKVDTVPFPASDLQVHRTFEIWVPQHFGKVAQYNIRLCIL